jgi:UDP-N-acetyl-D-mannosaminuronic acid transferase (WecB/TagA/CpsF family)
MIVMEPKGLWRRYLVEDMEFFWLILKQRLGLGAGAPQDDSENG